MYETFTSVYLTTGSRVKTTKEIDSIFKIREGGGLLWSKISAEIPHSKLCGPRNILQVNYFEEIVSEVLLE